MPLVERPAAVAASLPSTASFGPIFSMPSTMHAKSSSYPTTTTVPPSPDAVSAVAASSKPPISPPQALPSMPSLMRLPSLVTRTNQALHIQPPVVPPVVHSHRPSVIATPQAQTRLLTPAVALPPSPQGTEPPSPRELAARLALLLHARECCTPLDMERVCGVRNCRVARGVLDHCQECFLPEGQCHRSCSEAKQLLRHFRVCRAQHFQRACAVCALLRTEFAWAMQHARSLTPLFVPPTSTPSTMEQDDVFHQQHLQQHAEPQRRHSSYQPEPYMGAAAAASVALRRSVSEGPHATMSAAGHHHKRSAAATAHTQQASMEPPLAAPTVKRVRIVTPTEEAEAARAKKDRTATP